MFENNTNFKHLDHIPYSKFIFLFFIILLILYYRRFWEKHEENIFAAHFCPCDFFSLSYKRLPTIVGIIMFQHSRLSLPRHVWLPFVPDILNFYFRSQLRMFVSRRPLLTPALPFKLRMFVFRHPLFIYLTSAPPFKLLTSSLSEVVLKDSIVMKFSLTTTKFDF